MVRNYKKKITEGVEKQMKLAIHEVLDEKRIIHWPAELHALQTTLKRKVKKAKKIENRIKTVKVFLCPIPTVFCEEQILVAYPKEMEGRLVGLSTSKLQKLVYENRVGKEWLRGFLN